MKYLSLNSVVNAYLSNSDVTYSNFWGTLGIISVINQDIEPSKSYAFDREDVANFLDNLFFISEKKNTYPSRQWYAMFSNFWETKLVENMTKTRAKVDALAVAIWYYRRKQFEKTLTATELCSLLQKDLRLSDEQFNSIFYLQSETEFILSEPEFILEFDDYRYSEDELYQRLKSLGSEKELLKTGKTVKPDKTFINSKPGDFASAPFVQTIYAQQGSYECIFISQFNIGEYYTTKNLPNNNQINPDIKSNNISDFWSQIGEIVLSADNGFSKLPTYYHKGHIRVRCNYGGACNFSVGFYDKNDARVNSNISFEYNGSTSDNIDDNIFYLTTDCQDTVAFDRFIPVFNNAYQGMFEIQKINDEFIFINHIDQRKPLYTSKKRRQVIYFGAPGTGKSHAVDKIVKKEAPKRNIRTTFHPDSDYSSFVGCYKPTMRDGNIEYSFIAQAFINAYVGAWSDLSQPFYLVIEEINRGNCAQIFGDIFQLLDRDSLGESNYSIRPDSDLQKYLADKLGLFTNIPEEIRNGYEMRLPRNLFIYATMNTSDQSLFPIDSAFKRRWDWRYTAIKAAENDHAININGIRYNWTSFIREVNKKILDLTKSEDKQLGYWFIKPDDNGDIDWELFVSKALFYLWNDVIKDYATLEKSDSPFGRNYAFSTYFDENGEPLADRVVSFLDAMNIDKLPDSSDNNTDVSNSVSSVGNENLTNLKIGKAVKTAVSMVSKHFTFDELNEQFSKLFDIKRYDCNGLKIGHPDEHNGSLAQPRFYTTPFESKDGKTFTLISQWYENDRPRLQRFVSAFPEIFPNGLESLEQSTGDETAD